MFKRKNNQPQNDIKNSHFRTWKKGKSWCYAASALTVLALSGAGTVAVIQANQPAHAETTEKPTGKVPEPANANLTTPPLDWSPKIMGEKATKNGTVDKGTTTVNRTSDGITMNNPSGVTGDVSVTQIDMKWIQDPTKILFDCGGTWWGGRAPFTVNFDTDKPLQKGQKVVIPLKMELTIFNAVSSTPHHSLSGEGTTISVDGSYKYDWDWNGGKLIVTALNNANNTSFKGLQVFSDTMSFLLSPIAAVPAGLTDGGDIKNVLGTTGAGAKFRVLLSGQETTTTLTNTQALKFDANFDEYNADWSNSNKTEDITTTMRTSTSGWWWGALWLSNTHHSATSILDGGYTTVKMKGVSNAKYTGLPIKEGVLIGLFYPVGKNLDTGRNIVAPLVLNMMNYHDIVTPTVISNEDYDAATNTISFRVSRKVEDWANFARTYLANKEAVGKTSSYAIKYLERMAKDNNVAHLVPYIQALEFNTNTQFAPVNWNNDMKVDFETTNSTTGKTWGQHFTVKPYKAGEADPTKLVNQVQTVDKDGKPLGKGLETFALNKGDSWNYTPPQIKGYRHVSTNDSSILKLLGITNVAQPTGTVTDALIGKINTLVFAYEKSASRVKVEYLDQDDQNKVIATQTLDGQVGNAYDNNAGYTDKVTFFQGKGYELVSADNGAKTGTYQTDDVNKPDTYKVILKHGQKTENTSKTVKQTINYVVEGGKVQAPASNVQDFTFANAKTIDKVTGKVLKDDWTAPQNAKEVVSSNIPGYTPDQVKVPGKTYDQNSQNAVITVTYKANASRVHVNYLDKDENNKIIAQQILDGRYGNAYDNAKAYEAQLQVLREKGYELVNADDGAKAGIYMGQNPEQKVIYNVVLRHGKKQIQPQNAANQRNLTQTIHYVDEQGKALGKDQVQKRFFQNTQTVDKVNGKVLANDWGPSQKTIAVSTPKFRGYQPIAIDGAQNNPGATPKLVTEGTFNHDSQSTVITIKHKLMASRATVTYIDTDQNAEIPNDVISKQVIDGWAGKPYDNHKDYEATLNRLKAKGYELVKADEGAKAGTFVTEDVTSPDEYYVYLKHGTRINKVEKMVKQTIRYKVNSAAPTAPKAPATNLQHFTFVDTQTVDKVTHAILKHDWSAPQDSQEVVSPALPGYTPDLAKINRQAYKHDSKDQTVNVTYQADEQKLHIKVVDASGITNPNKFDQGKILNQFNAEVKGKTDEAYDNTKRLKDLKAKVEQAGYAFITQDKGIESGVFDKDTPKDQVFHVIVKQKIKVKVVYRDIRRTPKTNTPTGGKIGEQELNGIADNTYDNTKDYQTKLAELAKQGYVLNKHDEKVEKGTFTKNETVYVDFKRLSQVAKLTVKNQHLKVGDKFDAKANFVSLIDGDNQKIDYSQVKVTGAEQVNTSKNGTYLVTYAYQMAEDNVLSATSIVTVGSGSSTTDAPLPDVKGIAIRSHDVTIQQGETFDPQSGFDGVQDHDKKIDFKDITVKSNVDSLKAGYYVVAYTYTDKDGRSSTVMNNVTVTPSQATTPMTPAQNLTPATINSVDSTLWVGNNWKPADNFTGGKDEFGKPLTFDKVKVEGKADTSKAGVYKVTYSYKDVTGKVVKTTATITVKAKNIVAQVVNNINKVFPKTGEEKGLALFISALGVLFIGLALLLKRKGWFNGKKKR